MNTAIVAPSHPISAQTGLIGLVSATNQTCINLTGMCNKRSAQTVLIRATLREVTELQLSVQRLQQNLRRAELGSLPQAERTALVNVDTLIVALAESILAMSDFGRKVFNILSLARDMATSPSEFVSRYAMTIREGVNRVTSCRTTLTKLATILESAQETEAQRFRGGVEEATAGIIESNFWLGVKMDEMPATFSGMTLKDVGRASLVSLPLETSELRFGGEFFTTEYTSHFAEDAGELV
ncbi:hypothetical protein V8C37DRAFT_377372 [Trichoderma ceciliae]